MHLDAMAIAVVDRAMNERANVEITAQFAVDAMEHIEIEARGDARGIVIGVIKHALVLLEIDADHHPRAVPRMSRALRRKAQASWGSKLPSVDPGKNPTFGIAPMASGNSNGAVKSAVTG